MASPMFGAVLDFLRKARAHRELEELSDGDLLARFLAQREEAAFAALMHRHGPMVFRVCCRVLGDSHSAEDAYQATFMVLVRRAPSLRRRRALGSWLYAVAQRVALKARAAAAAGKRREWKATTMSRNARGFSDQIDEATWQQLCAVLDEEIGQLPEKWRAPIVLCYFEGLSYDQAAKELGWAKSSLASRLARGREMLRQRLVQRGIALSAAALTTALAEKAAPAAVGALLIIKTAKAASSLAAGKSVAASLLSTQAVAWAEEVIKGMLTMKIKLVLLVVACSLAVGSVGWGAHQFWNDGPNRARVDISENAMNAALIGHAQEKPKEDQPKFDQAGDPLPAGAVARLGTVRWRHDAIIDFAAFLPDNKRVVSVAGDKTIRLWEFPSGKELRRISVPVIEAPGGGPPATSDRPLACGGALSKDGELIATFFDNRLRGKKDSGPEIRVHEVETGKELFFGRIPGPGAGMVSAIFFSPSAEQLAVVLSGSIIHIWEWAKGKELPQLNIPGSRDSLPANLSYAPLTFSADGSALLFYGHSNALSFLDARTAQEIKETGGTLPVESIQFTGDGRKLITRARDQSMAIWEAATGKNLGSIGKPSDTGKLLKSSDRARLTSPDGQIRLESPRYTSPKGKESDIALFDAATDKQLGFIPTPTSATQKAMGELSAQPTSAATVLFSPGNKLLAFFFPSSDGPAKFKGKANEDGKIELYDVATAKRLHTLSLTANRPPPPPKIAAGPLGQTLVFAPDGRTLAWRLGDKFYLWDTASGKLTGSLPIPNGMGVDNAAFTPDGRCLALDMDDGTAVLCEVATAGPRRIFGQPWSKNAGKSPFDNRRPAPVLRQGPLQLHPASRIAISPDGKSLALAAEDRIVHVWDIATGRELAAFKGHDGKLNAVAFSPNNKLIASASTDTTALVWDLTNLKRPAPAAKTLRPSELDQCWQNVAGNEAGKAFTAICDLAASPKQAIALIREKLPPVPPADLKRIGELIGQLADGTFKVREVATNELNKFGEQIIPALEKSLADNLPLESKRRLEEMRDRLTAKILEGDRLRGYRAVEVLESIGTPEARQVLEVLAKGAPGTLLTKSAQEALKR